MRDHMCQEVVAAHACTRILIAPQLYLTVAASAATSIDILLVYYLECHTVTVYMLYLLLNFCGQLLGNRQLHS